MVAKATKDKSKPKSKAGASQSSKAGKSAPEAAVEAAPEVKPTVSHVLGEMTWLLSQSPTHRHLSIADLEWFLMPPLMLEQFRVFRNGTTPVGFALWAWLDEEAEKKLEATGRLAPQQWRAGGINVAHLQGMDPKAAPASEKPKGNLWLVELIAPQATPENKLTEVMLGDLLQGPLAGQKMKFHMINPETKQREVQEIGG